MALRRLVVLLLVSNRLITNVAEQLLAVLAGDRVILPFLLVDRAALWTRDTQLDVDVGVVIETQMLLNQVLGDARGLQGSFLRDALWVLFEVFLAFGFFATRPADPREADGALDVGAAGRVFRDRYAALEVGTRFCAVLDEQH